MFHDVSFKKYTRLMIQSLGEGAVGMFNYFPSKNSVSETMIPSMIVEGKKKIYMGLKMIECGAHAMVYSGTKNTMKKRSSHKLRQ